MFDKNLKTGAFIVPTGIGASIGGYAGDAGAYARKFAENTNLIVMNSDSLNLFFKVNLTS